VSIIAISLNIVLAFWLARPQSYGVAGLAIAQSVVAGVEVLILSMIMLWRDRKLFKDIEFWGGLVRIIGVAGFCLTTGFMMLQLYPLTLNDRGLITIGSKVFIIASAVFAVHLVISSLFGLREASAVFERLKKLIIKPIRIQ
jgi:peptidoglycan biosynthesis protein MviN/MurJ (putative lipid II flippase)